MAIDNRKKKVMASLRSRMRYLDPYDVHKLIVNEYVLRKPGDTKLFQRDNSKDKTDYHILKEHHKFLWDDKEPDSWEEQFAKRYYEKLFKEYCIADLSKYKENKVALRWRIEKEVVCGKGQFICGNKICTEIENLRSWEVNFGYQENQERKNVLVKIRLCPSCSKKLNYHSKKREAKRLRPKINYKSKSLSDNKSRSSDHVDDNKSSDDRPSTSNPDVSRDKETTEESPWADHKPVELKSREEEMEEYLQNLLL